ncbi:hypothetical protein BK710_12735 [Bacillus thuringiensis serovar sumiyoshiensis]|nr:hypothetical protein BK710_12735 [Bacillus thuringiensis serovar sumiyoshiensis]
MHMIKENNFSRNPSCSLKCVLYLYQNQLKLRWFSWRKEPYSIFAADLLIQLYYINKQIIEG